jgi:ABC-type sugar transport system ATPase subunit
VVALIGENGAGKSTLMKILRRLPARCRRNHHRWKARDDSEVQDATRYGIGFIHQGFIFSTILISPRTFFSGANLLGVARCG